MRTRTNLAKRLTVDDVLPMSSYGSIRRKKRDEISKIKKTRRVNVGPFATLHFENYDTMWHQVHEMLYVEKGGKSQMIEELSAYNPLIPNGSELIATLMLEIDDSIRRERELRRLTGIEKTIELRIAESIISAIPEDDVYRTKSDGKTSAVHFIRFSLSEKNKKLFADLSTKIAIVFLHPNYQYTSNISKEIRESLIQDLI